jgi:hypothetical protein
MRRRRRYVVTPDTDGARNGNADLMRRAWTSRVTHPPLRSQLGAHKKMRQREGKKCQVNL